MKRYIPNWVTLCLISCLLAGCELLFQAGPGLTTGREDYLKSIKPRLQYYEKPGWTSETRRQDAAECGASGDSSDRADIGSARIKAAQLPGEIERQTEFRLRQAWLDCMREKGYRYMHAAPK